MGSYDGVVFIVIIVAVSLHLAVARSASKDRVAQSVSKTLKFSKKPRVVFETPSSIGNEVVKTTGSSEDEVHFTERKVAKVQLPANLVEYQSGVPPRNPHRSIVVSRTTISDLADGIEHEDTKNMPSSNFPIVAQTIDKKAAALFNSADTVPSGKDESAKTETYVRLAVSNLGESTSETVRDSDVEHDVDISFSGGPDTTYDLHGETKSTHGAAISHSSPLNEQEAVIVPTQSSRTGGEVYAIDSLVSVFVSICIYILGLFVISRDR